MAAHQNDRAIFEEDQVSMFDGDVCKYGLVLESAEYMSSEDDDEEDSQELFQRVTSGTVRVAWHPDGTEEVIQESKLKLEDRALMPGDVVRRLIHGQDSQRGYVTATHVMCNVQVLGTNFVINNVDSKCLQSLEQWEMDPGDVYLDSWVGKIDGIVEILHVKLPDGTKFTIDSDDALNLFEDVCDRRDIDSEFYATTFYEGQRIVARKKDLIEPVKKDNPKYQWPRRKGGQNKYICTIENVEIKRMEVHWSCRGYAQAESPEGLNSPPPRTLDAEHIARLKKFDCFASCSVQIGDKARYLIKPDDVIQNVNPKSKSHSMASGDESNATGACGGLEIEENKKNLSRNDLTSDLCVSSPGPEGDSPGVILPASDVIDTIIEEAIAEASQNEASDSREQMESARGGNVGKNPSVKSNTISPTDNSNCNNTKDRSNRQDIQDSKSKGTKSKVDKQPVKKYPREKAVVEDEGSTVSTPLAPPTGDNTRNDADAAEEVDGEDSAENDTTSESDSTDSEVNFNLLQKHDSLLRGVLGGVENDPLLVSVPPAACPQPGDLVPVEITYTKSFINLTWQDGSREQNIKSSVLFPIHHLDELEFFPGDYVVSASADSDVNVYGVVEKVQHCERTCIVRWMKPYQVGCSNRPDVNIESEEVSVYDIKDHPDYQYRPGHVVVRVGGYQEGEPVSDTAAAGQVYELGQDGRILVQWADSTQSHCYPQEIYLIDYDLPELDDSVEDSSSDEYESENSDGDWVTDEEIEEDATDTDNLMNTYSVLCVEASDKNDLDQSMDKAISGLQQLEDMCNKALVERLLDSVPQILEELLRTFHRCRLLDKTLKTTYFRDANLTILMKAVRGMLDRERDDRVIRKARDLFYANTGRTVDKREQTDEPCDTKGLTDQTAGSSSLVTDGQMGGEMNGASSVQNSADATTMEDVASGASVELNANSSNSTSGNKLGSPSGASDMPFGEINASFGDDLKLLTLLQDFLNVDSEIKVLLDRSKHSTERKQGKLGDISNKMSGDIPEKQRDDISDKKPADSSDKKSADGSDRKPGDVDGSDDVPWWCTDVGPSALPPVLLLSCMTCRLLSTQLGKVRADLLQKWEELKRCGKLKVLDDMSDVDDSSPVDKEKVDEGSSVDPDDYPVSAVSDTPPGRDKLHLSLNLQDTSLDMIKSPITPQTPADVRAKLEYNMEGFTIEDEAPATHRFISAQHEPCDLKAFTTAVRKEMNVLRTGLPRSIFVKGYSDRMDLYSVMMIGPSCTPYEDGVFFFEIQLPNDYPFTPPRVHYLSFCSDRLNPNLYEDGKVCISLLGTWTGRGTEVWTNMSCLLQVLISIQGLILVAEPYYNEAGYEKQKGSQHGVENSRMYNEMAILKMVESMTRLCNKAPDVFTQETKNHLHTHAYRMLCRFKRWLQAASEPGGNVASDKEVESASGVDSGSKVDSGSMVDSGCHVHSGSKVDSGYHIDSGSHMDSGSQVDSGSRKTVTAPVLSSNAITACADGAAMKTGSVPDQTSTTSLPDFPLFPLSKGFQITLKKLLTQFESTLNKHGYPIVLS